MKIMYNTKTLFTLFFLTLSILSISQNQEVEFLPDGVIFPWMNTTQRNAITSMQGQSIFNTQTRSI